MSADTYGLMWLTLEACYDKPRIVSSTLIAKLFSVPLTPHGNIAALKKFMLVFDEGVLVLNFLHISNPGDFLLFALASQCPPI